MSRLILNASEKSNFQLTISLANIFLTALNAREKQAIKFILNSHSTGFLSVSCGEILKQKLNI